MHAAAQLSFSNKVLDPNLGRVAAHFQDGSLDVISMIKIIPTRMPRDQITLPRCVSRLVQLASSTPGSTVSTSRVLGLQAILYAHVAFT